MQICAGIKANWDKSRTLPVANQLLQLLEDKKADIVLDIESAARCSRPDLGVPTAEFLDRAEMIFVLGGDGTILGVAREVAGHRIPLIGINVGHLGFLSEAEPQSLSCAVDCVLKGDYVVEERLMLKTELIRDNQIIQSGIALNDVGIGKGSFSRMISCKVWMDDLFLGHYSGDGLIVSSPTGSTAYSLSCGGPIVYPDMQVLLLTPICPHTLTSRPMVLPPDARIQVEVMASHLEMDMTIDGQIGFCLKNNDVIRISRSEVCTSLIKWKDKSFFELVRKKLQGDGLG